MSTRKSSLEHFEMFFFPGWILAVNQYILGKMFWDKVWCYWIIVVFMPNRRKQYFIRRKEERIDGEKEENFQYLINALDITNQMNDCGTNQCYGSIHSLDWDLLSSHVFFSSHGEPYVPHRSTCLIRFRGLNANFGICGHNSSTHDQY